MGFARQILCGELKDDRNTELVRKLSISITGRELWETDYLENTKLSCFLYWTAIKEERIPQLTKFTEIAEKDIHRAGFTPEIQVDFITEAIEYFQEAYKI